MDYLKLQEIVKEYVGMHGNEPVVRSVFVTWLCGNCHTYPKRANEIIAEMKYHGLVVTRKDIVCIC